MFDSCPLSNPQLYILQFEDTQIPQQMLSPEIAKIVTNSI